MQQYLLEFLQGGELAFVEAGEVLGFFLKQLESIDNLCLLLN
jgi:hypothetical protein